MTRFNLKTFFLLIALLCLPLSSSAINVQEHMLDNGLKVLILEDHKAPTATFQVWYRVGSSYENIGKTGLSHLLEHMMFKGTKKHGPKTFSQSIQRAGGTDNAFTTGEYTGYFELLASDRLGLPVELEADRMQNLVLTDEAVLSERDVVMEERRLRYEDDPQNLLYEEVVAATYKNHPYRWPVIGWMSDLKTLNPDDLRQHYATYYAPNNAVILVVGDVRPQEILAKIRDAFGKIPRGPQIRTVRASEDPQHGEKRIILRREAELPAVLVAFKVPAIHQVDGPALDVLGSVLSGGKSTRIYNSLVYEKQLALSAWAGYDGMRRDMTLFYAQATAARGKDIQDVEKALLAELEKIRKEPPSGSEMQKAKNQVEASFIMEQDSFYMQARLIGTFEMTGGWRLIDSYLEGIRRVTADDVMRVAEKYLVPERKTTGILMPLEPKK